MSVPDPPTTKIKSKIMIGKFKKSISHAGEVIKEQAAALGDAAKQKGYDIIGDWISILPKLKSYGFEVSFFSLSVSINPTLEVELVGEAEKFDMEYIEKLLEESKGSTPLNLVFTSIKTTHQFHQRAELETLNPLCVRIRVRLSPEIRVSYGEPICE